MSTTGSHLHHVGVVVPSEQQARDMMRLLGLREAERGFVEQYRSLCVFTEGKGSSPIEFVIPDGGPLTEFNRGIGGLHHVALEVDSLAELTAELGAQGISLLESEPVRGAGQFMCNFLDPVYTRGLIVEFVEPLRQQTPS
jgi:catechol 2,3-dioxygenase-like lactoylglutathione lyase family enzyme